VSDSTRILTPLVRRRWRTTVSDLKLSQPDASTCQATCLGMAVGREDIWHIRGNLLGMGTPGDPFVMADWARPRFPGYEFHEDASLLDALLWIARGDLLITHGWFTRSGHVIVIDGAEVAVPKFLGRISSALPWTATPSPRDVRFDVVDPWSEFDGPGWRYPYGSKMFDGFYSARLMWAACVAGTSWSHARRLYQQGTPRLEAGGMWVHRFPTLSNAYLEGSVV